MAKLRVFAGIDLSTTGARVELVDEDGTIVGSGATDHSTIGALTQSIPAWTEAVGQAFQRALSGVRESPQIITVGVASQGITVIPMDSGEPAGSVTSWLSSHGTVTDEEMWFQRSGRRMVSAFLPMQAMSRRGLGVAPPERWMLVGEALTTGWTQEHIVDPCLASTTGLVDPATRTWAPDLLDYAGVPRDALPEIVESPAGAVPVRHPEALVGTDTSTLIAPPTQDQRAAASLAEACGADLVITSGTASVIAAKVDRAIIDPAGRIPVTPSLTPTTWELEGVVAAAGAALIWAAEAMAFSSVKTLLDAADSVATTRTSPEFMPYLTGSGSPDWDPSVRGGLAGLRLEHGRADLARAVVVGVCEEIVRNVVAVEEIVGRRDRVAFVGGLTRHRLVARTLADAMGRPLRVIRAAQPTALGAAARGAEVVGIDLLTRIAAQTLVDDVDPHERSRREGRHP